MWCPDGAALHLRCTDHPVVQKDIGDSKPSAYHIELSSGCWDKYRKARELPPFCALALRLQSPSFVLRALQLRVSESERKTIVSMRAAWAEKMQSLAKLVAAASNMPEPLCLLVRGYAEVSPPARRSVRRPGLRFHPSVCLRWLARFSHSSPAREWCCSMPQSVDIHFRPDSYLPMK